MLANTKRKAKEVSEKLTAADETKRNINEKREQFRQIATRGSVLYFAIVDMSGVNCMYQTSLVQFVDIFMSSMDEAEKAALAQKRQQHYPNDDVHHLPVHQRRASTKHKLTFIIVCCTKILVTPAAHGRRPLPPRWRGRRPDLGARSLQVDDLRRRLVQPSS